ncbi:MAG: Zn-dependent oligopeptidase [Pseudomonadota bacterium]|nr:Zn-dependent oligopeptidase [Pseudomonadota bacterium]
MPLLDAKAINERCDDELAAARAGMVRMERVKGGAGVLADFNRLALLSGGFSNPVYLLANVADDQPTRDAAEACIAKLTPFETELYQSRELFERVQALKPADAVERVYRQDLLNRFEDAGASLPPAKRARAKAIQDQLEILGLAYGKTVNEDPTTVLITPEEAAGMPEAWVSARKRNDAGQLVLGMDYPTVLPFLQNASNEDARRRLWTAFSQRGGMPNVERLDQALALRHELAELHGEPDYASFALRRRMAGTPKAVLDFLARVRESVVGLEKQELDVLRAEKAALLKLPLADVKLERWDVSYLQERVKQAKYSIDQEKLRAYFPSEASVAFAMRLAEHLYGIEFVAGKEPVWHPDVRYYDVYERDGDHPEGNGAKSSRGAFIGSVYLDLFPRKGKYGHAAAFPVFPASTLVGTKPTSVLVTNFNPVGLDHDELETLLHEFGHVLHGVLSKARYADEAGTSVKRDFVEAPSQMFEEWARRPETLAVFAEVCPTCPRLSTEQLKQLDAARTFGRGVRYSRQWEYASYDMRLHTGTLKPALPTWVTLEQSMPLGYVEGSLVPANFGHLMGGYAAGYYGYMWSEVLALDMLSAFHGKLMDPAVGKRYRQLILSRGGEVPPQQMVEQFLGRKPNPDAFFAEITGKR